MSMMLREYLNACLPEPVSEDRLTLFIEQADVQEYVIQIEQLTDRFVSKWKEQLANTTVEVKLEVEQTQMATPTSNVIASVDTMAQTNSSMEDTTTEPKQREDQEAEPYHLFLASKDEMENGEHLETDLNLATVQNGNTNASIPELTAEPVRLVPTNPSVTPTPQPDRTIPIPNAMVGKPYSYVFDFGMLGIGEVTDHKLSENPATGLLYDPETRSLSGNPLEAGEVSFELTYRLKTVEPDRPVLTRRIQLLINPDPRSLWKDLPSDVSDPYHKSDSDKKLLSIGDARLVAASVRGRSHAHEGKFRDDDFSLAHFSETDWYLLTVADGAGSATYSRRGAQLACDTVTQYLQSSIEAQSWSSLDEFINQYVLDRQESVAGDVQRQLYDVLGKAVFEAYKAIEAEAIAKAAATKDYATTLITVLARPVADGWFIGAFWVGDGGVGIYRSDKEPIILGTPDGGEYAGQTRFLTMSETIANNFFGRFRFALVEDFKAIVLMTDGITDPKFQTDANLNRKEKWDELWTDLNEKVSFMDDELAPDQLLNWLTFWSPGNHDDRTIAMLYTHAGNDKN